MAEPTTEELIERWLAGEPGAGEALCARYLERARDLARRLARRGDIDPDDVAAEALSAGLEGLRGGRRPDQFTLWLHGVVRNVVRHRIRDRKAAKPVTDSRPQSGSGPFTRASKREMLGLMNRIVPSLPDGSRQVIELIQQGRSRSEIADLLGIPLDAVHARFARGVKQIREEMSRQCTTLVVGRGPVAWEEVERLRPTFREAVVRRHLEGLSASEAARKIGVPVDTLEARLQTAYESLGCDDSADFSPAREQWLKTGKR